MLAAVREEQAALMAKLVAFCMAAEIVVVVQDQDASVSARFLAIEIGGGQAAEAGADDDEIVLLPWLPQTYLTLASLAPFVGDEPDSAIHLIKARQFAGGDPKLWYQIGVLEMAAGRTNAALACSAAAARPALRI